MGLIIIQENKILRKLEQMAWNINANKVQDSVESISEMLDKLGIEHYVVNPTTFVVDVNSSVKLSGKLSKLDIDEIPCQFGKVTGNFDVSHNNLASLIGSPQKVGGNYYCFNSNLTSLEGAPKTADGGFHCQNNKLISLDDLPKEIGSSLFCQNNKAKFSNDDVAAISKVGGKIEC